MMSPNQPFIARYSRIILSLLFFLALYLISQANYLLFHTAAELFSITIALTVFVLTWNSRRYLENGYMVFIGVASLMMGGIDLLHTLAYRGMGVFIADTDLPTQLWLAGRYIQSLSFLIAPMMITHRSRVPLGLAGIGGLAALMLASIFAWDTFPAAYVEGVGLTSFKIISEYLMILIFAAGIGLLWINRNHFDREVARHLMMSMAWGIASELSATLYVDVYGFFNTALHFFKILAFYHLYKAIIESGFLRPYNTIFRSLKASEAELQRSHDELEKLVAQRTQDLESQRTMLETVLTQAADGILVVNPQGRVTFANQVARRMTLKPDADESDYVLSDFGVPSIDGVPLPMEQRPAYMALRGETVAGHEVCMEQQEGGRQFYLMISAAPLRGPDGQITAAVVSFTDITERRRAQEMLRRANADLETRVNERTAELRAVNQQLSQELQMRVKAEDALRASEARLRRLVDSNIIGVEFANISGEITEANDAFLSMIGYDREDLAQGRINWIAMTPPEHNEADQRGLREAAESGACTPYEKEYLRKDGSRVPIMLGYARLEDHHDRFICFVLDLSEQKRAEEAIRHYNEELERSNRELQDFAYVASHDLQEPLRKIVAFGDRLQESATSRLDDREKDYLNRMQRSAARMRAMINDLLALSRITTRAQPFAEVDLNVVASDVLSDLEMRVERSGARVIIEPLPTVEADPMQMRQLLQNLIANAIKFNRPGVAPEVHVFAQTPENTPDSDGHIRLLVEDNGIGFEEQYLDRVFQPFQRLHGMGEYEGSGMGLAICQKIVQRHGGAITAHSQPGYGSTFMVTLPLKQEEK